MAGERRRRRLRRGSGDDAASTDAPVGRPPPGNEAAPGNQAAPGNEPPPGDAQAGRGAHNDAPAVETTPAALTAGGRRERAVPGSPAGRPPSPHDLAELGGTFALTTAVHDPDADVPEGMGELTERGDDAPTERGLRGLVGGGSSQVSVAAAMRARDAARPTAADLAAAEAELVIVRRGWVPREELPRGGPRRP